MHVCVCVFSSLKVFQFTLMSAGSGRLLRSTKWPSSTQLLQPSACWWSTDGNHCRSKRHLNVKAAQKNPNFFFLVLQKYFPEAIAGVWLLRHGQQGFPAFIWRFPPLIMKELLLCSHFLCNTLSGEGINQTVWIMMWVILCEHGFFFIPFQQYTHKYP